MPETTSKLRGLAVRALLPLVLAGCARYEPAPIDPAAHPAVYRSRRLDDPVLREWIARYAGAPRDDRWDDRRLVLAALAFRADLERARREWLAARAEAVAAGVRPAPGVEAGVERAVGGREESSPWVVSLAGLFTVELGGKRAARRRLARARETAAEAELSLMVWATGARVREAALAARAAEVELEDAVAVADALGRVEALEQGRYAEAALGSGEVARTAAEAAAARGDVAAARHRAGLARAALAGALAVPAGSLATLELAPPAGAGCVWSAALGGDSIAALALTRRGDVALALAHYAAAEAELHARVAAQRPDLELGPGFIWDQGVHRWTLAAALPGLLGLRRTAPITAAVARRHAAAARVAEVQDRVYDDAVRAAADCAGATAVLAVADSGLAAARRLAELARDRYQRGESGTLEQARADLALARARAARRSAARRVEEAGLRLEGSTSDWREDGPVRWPDPRVEPLTPGEVDR